MRKKDLFKPGRNLNDYLDEDGNIIKNCTTCIHRNKIADCRIGDFMCKGGYPQHQKCNPNYEEACKTNDIDNMLHYLFWESRVTNGIIDDDDFKLD